MSEDIVEGVASALIPRGCRRFLSFIGVLAFIGIGVFFCLLVYSPVRLGYDSSSWPSAQGQIISPSGAGEVAYNYTVDGRRYTASMVAPGDFLSSDYTFYAEGEVVTVYYDPANPATALLKPGLDNSLLILGGLLSCFPIAGIWGLLRLLGLRLDGWRRTEHW